MACDVAGQEVRFIPRLCKFYVSGSRSGDKCLEMHTPQDARLPKFETLVLDGVWPLPFLLAPGSQAGRMFEAKTTTSRTSDEVHQRTSSRASGSTAAGPGDGVTASSRMTINDTNGRVSTSMAHLPGQKTTRIDNSGAVSARGKGT